MITAASAVYQRVTGPTYPLSGAVKFEGKQIKYKFQRSHSTSSDYKIEIKTGDSAIRGTLFWRRFKFDQDFSEIEMNGKETLFAELPKQPSSGKLEYFVELYKGKESVVIPNNVSLVIRFKDDVPIWILIPHVIAMFCAMLLSTRAGLEFFNKEPKLTKLTNWTLGFLFAGGLILGPLVQYYAFGAFWTGVPFGFDLTDNKTLIAMLVWLFAWYMMRRSSNPKKWVLIASVVMLIIFLIPHSVLGSEFDYSRAKGLVR